MLLLQGGKPTGLFGAYLSNLAKNVPVGRRRALLDSNAPISVFMSNENEVNDVEPDCPRM